MSIENPKSAAIYAREFSAAFVTKERENGDTFVCLRDDRPDWMRDAIFEAHENLGGMFPHDWVYRACEAAADFLSDNDPENWEDCDGDFADANTEIHTAELYEWAAEHANFRDLIAEAREDLGGTGDHERDIQLAQYLAYTKVYAAIREALEEQAENEPCAWFVNWNLPGYMPDNEPSGFEDWSEAADCLADEIERYKEEQEQAEDWEESAESRERAETCETLARQLRDGVNENTGESIEDTEQGFYFGEYFWNLYKG